MAGTLRTFSLLPGTSRSHGEVLLLGVCACVRACPCVCARACAFVCARVRLCVRTRVCVFSKHTSD